DVKGHVLQGHGAVGIGFVNVGEADHVLKIKRSRVQGRGSRRCRPWTLYFRPCSRSPIMSAASSMPQLSRRKPSGMPILARPSGPMLLWEVSRGSETRV